MIRLVHVPRCFRHPTHDVAARRFASALSVLGTENDNQVRAIGITVLPDGLFGKVLQIIFTPPDAPIRLCVEMNGEDMRISGVTVGTSMVSFSPASLSSRDFDAINQVRKIVSDAISGRQAQHSAKKIRPIIDNLMQASLMPRHVRFF
jgi:hypothetical protein